MNKIETMPTSEAAKALGLSHRKLVTAMLNGTVPIGAVIQPQFEGEKYCVRVYRDRFEKYVKGEL